MTLLRAPVLFALGLLAAALWALALGCGFAALAVGALINRVARENTPCEHEKN